MNEQKLDNLIAALETWNGMSNAMQRAFCWAFFHDYVDSDQFHVNTLLALVKRGYLTRRADPAYFTVTKSGRRFYDTLYVAIFKQREAA